MFISVKLLETGYFYARFDGFFFQYPHDFRTETDLPSRELEQFVFVPHHQEGYRADFLREVVAYWESQDRVHDEQYARSVHEIDRLRAELAEAREMLKYLENCRAAVSAAIERRNMDGDGITQPVLDQLRQAVGLPPMGDES